MYNVNACILHIYTYIYVYLRRVLSKRMLTLHLKVCLIFAIRICIHNYYTFICINYTACFLTCLQVPLPIQYLISGR